MLIVGIAAGLNCRATGIISIAAGIVFANLALVGTVVFVYKVLVFRCSGLVVTMIMAVIAVGMTGIVSVSVGMVVSRIMIMAVMVCGGRLATRRGVLFGATRTAASAHCGYKQATASRNLSKCEFEGLVT